MSDHDDWKNGLTDMVGQPMDDHESPTPGWMLRDADEEFQAALTQHEKEQAMSIKIVDTSKQEEVWQAWDDGHHILNNNEAKVFELPEGEKLGALMSDWTICPVGNSSCQDMAVLELFAVNPNKGGEATYVQLCPRGVSCFEKCPLNK